MTSSRFLEEWVIYFCILELTKMLLLAVHFIGISEHIQLFYPRMQSTISKIPSNPEGQGQQQTFLDGVMP